MSIEDLKPFLTWFQSHGGEIDVSSMDITTFSAAEGGRGAIALKDIPEGQTLFTIPRSLTLSTRTSELPTRFGIDQWKSMNLDVGWTGLILCMMWEGSRGASSQWSQYISTLPTAFDTPMFWDESDLAELRGTSVVDKLGREEAELSYREKLSPAIHSRPDLFPSEYIPEYYSLEAFHIMGSRILSRSFNVEKWGNGEDGAEDDHEHAAANSSRDSGMDVDSVDKPKEPSNELHETEDDDDDAEAEDSSDIAMVPMADMLNARYGSENAKLFYEETVLRMVSTKSIKAGEQIWNTYGDLPNAELLRRYGHVDLLPLPDGKEGNLGDVVEIRADLAVLAISQGHPSQTTDSLQERIDWWLEEGGDDTFVVESDGELPDLLVSLIRLLLVSDGEWEKIKDKGKLPKPKVDDPVLHVVKDVLERRLAEYSTGLKEDEQLVTGDLMMNKRHALIVRIGEKRILEDTLGKVNALVLIDQQRERKGGKTKRKGLGGEDDETRSKIKKSKH